MEPRNSAGNTHRESSHSSTLSTMEFLMTSICYVFYNPSSGNLATDCPLENVPNRITWNAFEQVYGLKQHTGVMRNENMKKITAVDYFLRDMPCN
ncbi:hypothetical protein KIN20_001861 [Parelaphostrongylus tenuis]|uniref:Uncharacterized protein n=1 Tax=Parelaphostrongylus tenuis TaxID=148309 RepID=A0AAD5QCL7_PARTN|nr:hypothetical protein KIN20_001861 [Parelaphostrongylus tenuis]